MPDDEPSIVSFELAAAKPEHRSRVTLAQRAWNDKACPHKHVIVDEDARTLECDDCGVSVDPISYLAQWAKADRMVDARLQEIRQHEAREAERAKAAEAERLARIPGTLASLRPGDLVDVAYRLDGSPGAFASGYLRVTDSADEALVGRFDGDPHRKTIPLSSITALRVSRRAKPSTEDGSS